MIRLVCMDGPLQGQELHRPGGLHGEPAEIRAVVHGGTYVATPVDRDEELRWRAYWRGWDYAGTATATLRGRL